MEFLEGTGLPSTTTGSAADEFDRADIARLNFDTRQRRA
jgi:hypothetical protein